MAGGDYGRIRHTFWTDPDIKRVLTPEQKVLLLYYFTSPHRTLIGLYYCPLEYAATETGLSLERVREWTDGALSRFVTYDYATEEIFVHRAGRHQIGDELKAADYRCASVERALAEVHSPSLVRKFLSLYQHWPITFEAPSEETEAPSEPLASPSEAKALAVTEQKQGNTTPNGVGGEPPKVGDAGWMATALANIAPDLETATKIPAPPLAPEKSDLEGMWAENRRLIAGAIRMYAWLDGDAPNVPMKGGRRWGMQNELSIAKELLKQYTPEELIGGLEFWRRANGGGDDEQFSLAQCYAEGKRFRIELAVDAWRNAEIDGAPMIDILSKIAARNAAA